LCPGQGLAWPAGGTQSVSWCLPWCFRCLPSGSCWRGPSPTTFRSRGEAAIARGDQWKSNGMWPGVQEIWCSTISTRLEKDCHDQKSLGLGGVPWSLAQSCGMWHPAHFSKSSVKSVGVSFFQDNVSLQLFSHAFAGQLCFRLGQPLSGNFKTSFGCSKFKPFWSHI
jgi:hypothetical protein